MTRSLARLATAATTAVAAVAMTAAPAAAEAGEGPYVFDSAGAGKAVSVVVGLPQSMAEGLAPAVAEVPGVTLEGNQLHVDLSSVLAELELPLADQRPGEVSALATVDSVTGSIGGLVDEAFGGANECFDSPVDITVPPDAATPLVSMTLLQARCVADEEGRVSIASSRIADFEVSLGGALAVLPPEASEPIGAAADQISAEVTEQVLTPLGDQVLAPVQDAINENTGAGVDLTEAVRVPELVDLPLASIDLIETTSENVTDGASVRSVSTATLAGVSLLGTICLPDATYRAEAFATGQPGGNGYSTSVPPIDVSICRTDSLSPILRLLEQDGVVGDVLVNLGDGELRPLGELLGGTGLPAQEVADGLDQALATIGVSTVVQGRETGATKSEDGRQAGVAVDPFRVAVTPFAEQAAGTPLEGLSVEVRGLAVAANVAAAPAPPPATEVAPDAAPEPALPRTGSGALGGVLGALALGGAFALRRRR